MHEFEANEFAHYVLNPTLFNKTTTFIVSHKAISIIAGILALLIIGGCIVTPIVLRQQSYYGNYYVSPSGTRYHEEDCFYIRDKKTKVRVTRDIVIERNLEPCKVCLPELRDE